MSRPVINPAPGMILRCTEIGCSIDFLQVLNVERGGIRLHSLLSGSIQTINHSDLSEDSALNFGRGYDESTPEMAERWIKAEAVRLRELIAIDEQNVAKRRAALSIMESNLRTLNR